MFEFDLVLFHYFPDPLKKVSIDYRLAFFKKKIGSLSNKSILVLDQAILKGSKIALAHSLHEGFELFQSVFVQYCIVLFRVFARRRKELNGIQK